MAPSRLLGLLFGAALAILRLFLVLTAAAFPAADDYCYALVSQHPGTLELTAAPGGDTQAWVRLPVSKAQDAARF